MPSRAIKKKRERGDGAIPSDWQSVREVAPSVVRAEQPAVPRLLGLLGFICVFTGMLALVLPLIGWNYQIAPGWGVFLVALGSCGLLYQAFTDKDMQFRRLYGLLGGLLLLTGLIAQILPTSQGLGGYSLSIGTPALLAALFFIMAFARNETDEGIRSNVLLAVGIVGLIAAASGFFLVLLFDKLMAQGVVLLVFGLFYLWAYASLEGGASTDRGYKAGWGLALMGSIAVVISLARSFGPWSLYQIGWIDSAPSTTFFVPTGVILIYFGLEYLLLGLTISSDSRIVVMTRRELQAIFFSPIAFVVLIGFTLIAWVQFGFIFLPILIGASQGGMMGGGGVVEPIFVRFAVSFPLLFSFMFIMPFFTMRLLSEEQRTGTLEVLLTAPVNETPVVLSKFFAVLRFFLLCWYPWGLFMVALRLEGGAEFDYRPALTFIIGLAATGAGLLAMGLFFSSLTGNQIVAAILTFVVVLAHTILFWIKQEPAVAQSMFGPILDYISYIDVWIDSSQGLLQPRKLIFHVAAAVFWLFLTVKVLEARKWK